MNNLLLNAALHDLFKSVRFDWMPVYSKDLKEIITINLN